MDGIIANNIIGKVCGDNGTASQFDGSRMHLFTFIRQNKRVVGHDGLVA